MYKRLVFGFSSNGLPIKVVLSNGKGLKCCKASREILQRVKLLVADILHKGFHIVGMSMLAINAWVKFFSHKTNFSDLEGAI